MRLCVSENLFKWGGIKKSRSFMKQWVACLWPHTLEALFPFVWLMSSLLPPPSSRCYWYHLSFKNLSQLLLCTVSFTLQLHSVIASWLALILRNGNLEVTSSSLQDTWAIHCSLWPTRFEHVFVQCSVLRGLHSLHQPCAFAVSSWVIADVLAVLPVSQQLSHLPLYVAKGPG